MVIIIRYYFLKSCILQMQDLNRLQKVKYKDIKKFYYGEHKNF